MAFQPIVFFVTGGEVQVTPNFRRPTIKIAGQA